MKKLRKVILEKNDNTAQPLTAGRVFMFEATRRRRVPGTGPHVPASDRPGAAAKIIKGKLSGERPQTPPKKRVKPGRRRLPGGGIVITDEEGNETRWD